MSIVLFVVIGGCLGSFLAWLGRMLMDRQGMKARSACDACRRTLAWWELIPIISYLGLGGRCRSCSAGILVTDWAMELVGAALFGLGAWRFEQPRELIWWCLLAFATMLLFYIDLRWMIVPRAFSVIVAFIAVLASVTHENVYIVLFTALLGAIFYFFLYAISGGHWVGDGDVALGFIVGAAVGEPTRLGLTLLIAHVCGGIVAALLLKLKKKQLGDALPMGAFLIPAMWIVLLWGGWYR